jgi:two-component system chemotaxis response regulator CheB
MISSLTAEGAEATLEAVELGAIDFVAKPSGAISLEIDRIRPALVEKVRCAAKARISRALRLRERIRSQFRESGVARTQRAAPAPRRGESPGLILIGSSTGGPAALDVVLPQFPADFPWPILIAQHMPASFTGPFARRLDRYCPLSVIEVSRPTPLKPGTIYIGRGDADVIVSTRAGGIIAMPAPSLPDYFWHPSVERMVESALEHHDAKNTIGILMTGMGRDGADAMTRLRNEGGHTIAEAESTAVVWGMPGELVSAGGAELILPLEEIAGAAVEWVGANAPH